MTVGATAFASTLEKPAGTVAKLKRSAKVPVKKCFNIKIPVKKYINTIIAQILLFCKYM